MHIPPMFHQNDVPLSYTTPMQAHVSTLTPCTLGSHSQMVRRSLMARNSYKDIRKTPPSKLTARRRPPRANSYQDRPRLPILKSHTNLHVRLKWQWFTQRTQALSKLMTSETQTAMLKKTCKHYGQTNKQPYHAKTHAKITFSCQAFHVWTTSYHE